MVRGRSAIVEQYRDSTEWAFGVFDRIEFESDVGSESEDSAVVTFTDHFYFGQAVHHHNCQQVVTMAENGQIDRARRSEERKRSTRCVLQEAWRGAAIGVMTTESGIFCRLRGIVCLQCPRFSF